LDLKFKEESSKVLHLECSFLWCWNLDTSEVDQKYVESFEMWAYRKTDYRMNEWMSALGKRWSSRYVFRKYVIRILVLAPIVLKVFCSFPQSLQQHFEILPQYGFLFPSYFYFIFPDHLIVL
jgi:hypothetical protein